MSGERAALPLSAGVVTEYVPGNEELYRCRMRVEHRAGNLAGVTAAYEELVTYLADLETEPSPATAALFHDLVRPAGRR